MLTLLLTLAFAPAEAAAFEVTAEDCAAFQAVLHAKHGSWSGLGGPRLRVTQELPDGPATQDLACPGIIGPGGEGAPSDVIVFDLPAYDRHASTATVSYTVLAYNHHRDVGRVTFRQLHACKLEFDSGEGWRTVGCKVVLTLDPSG